MSIRWKLMILLLAMALVPLVFVGFLGRRGTLGLGDEIAERTRRVLTENAALHMRQMIQGQTAVLAVRREALERALRVQARAVERRLADLVPSPVPAETLHWAADLDAGINLPDDYGPVPRYKRFADGKAAPIPVSLTRQNFYAPPGTFRQQLQAWAQRLAPLIDNYRFMRNEMPDILYWQYTALENGLHSSYPCSAGYAPDYDPRLRPWYRAAKEENGLFWFGPYADATTRQIMLTVSMPVRGPEGAIAGVTAIDITMFDIFARHEQRMKAAALPFGHPDARLVKLDVNPDTGALGMRILADPSYVGRTEADDAVFESDWFSCDRPQQTALMIQDLSAGHAEVRQLDYQGRRSLLAYGPFSEQGMYLVLLLPYQRVIAGAIEAQQYIIARTWVHVRTTAAFFFGGAGDRGGDLTDRFAHGDPANQGVGRGGAADCQRGPRRPRKGHLLR